MTSHAAYFARSVLDRLSNANWFEDPSNSSIACRQTGPLSLGDIDTSPQGEDVFIWSTSLIFKSLNVTRIFNQKTQVLIWMNYTSDLTQGGATKPEGLTQKLARNLAQVMRQFDGFGRAGGMLCVHRCGLNRRLGFFAHFFQRDLDAFVDGLAHDAVQRG